MGNRFIKFCMLLGFISLCQTNAHATAITLDVDQPSVASFITPLTAALKQAVPSFQPASSFHLTFIYTKADISADKASLLSEVSQVYPPQTVDFIPMHVHCLPTMTGGFHVVLLPDNIVPLNEINKFLNEKMALRGHGSHHTHQPRQHPLYLSDLTQGKYPPRSGFFPHIALGTLPATATPAEFDALAKATEKFIFQDTHLHHGAMIKFDKYS